MGDVFGRFVNATKRNDINMFWRNDRRVCSLAWLREEMKTVWVVILVTAVSPFNYNVAPLIDTLEECHRKAVYIEHDIQRSDNQEMICIKVDSE